MGYPIPMRLGTYAHTGDMSFPELLAYAQEAEGLGYDGFWVAEESGKEAFAALTAVAGATRRIGLGPSICSIYARTPLICAMGALTVDLASRGRFCLGLGTGGPGFVERGHGVPLDHPLARMREYVAIARGLLAGERVTYRGRFYHVDAFRLRERPAQATVPIMLAALNPRMTELAGEIADACCYNLLFPATAAEVRRQLAVGAARAGRDAAALPLYTLAPTVVDPDDPGAREALRRTLAFYCASQFYHDLIGRGGPGFLERAREVKREWDEGDKRRAVALVPDEMIATLTISGTRAQVATRLAGFRDAGVDPIIYPIPRPGRTAEDLSRGIHLAAELAPR